MVVGVASCSSSKNTSTSRYPNGTRTSKSQRTSDGYPGILFPDGRRTTTSTRGLPPGQAKKVYGDQSARAYAPGQQKKVSKGHGNGNGKGHHGGKKKKGKK